MSFIQVSTKDGQQISVFEVLHSDPNAPGIVLIQEIFGVNSAMRQLARDWSERGFNVWCPDLFFRSEPRLELNPTNESQYQLGVELMQELDNDQCLSDLEDVRAGLAKKLGHNGIAAIGFCMGGRLVVEMAARSPLLAAISYYGVNLENVIPTLSDTAPVLLHIAEQDKWVQGEARAVIEKEAASRKDWESYVYPNCDHAFARPNGQHYEASADQLAIERGLAFLKKHL